jgi:predicted metal-dependent hydrolase
MYILEDIIYDDEVLGRIHIRKSRKANRISIRIKESEVLLVIPSKLQTEEGIHFLQSKYDWVLSHLKQNKTVIFDENTVFRTITFELKIEKSSFSAFHFKLTSGLLTVSCPHHLDIRSEQSQTIIRTGIERAMQMEAKRILPKRLMLLAEKYHFSYSDVSIRSSKTRWGSCSSSRNISLSYFLLTLPSDLIDYVLLHELCHTKEMNHSVRFWKLMDAVTNNCSKELRAKLKNYNTSI